MESYQDDYANMFIYAQYSNLDCQNSKRPDDKILQIFSAREIPTNKNQFQQGRIALDKQDEIYTTKWKF